MAPPSTTEDFKLRVANLKDGDSYAVCGEYINLHTKVMMKHLVCGKEFLMAPKLFLGGSRCPYCRVLDRKTTEEFVQEVSFSEDGDEYLVLGEYLNARTPILIQHIVCGMEYRVEPSSFLKGCRCPYCRKGAKQRKTTAGFKQRVASLPHGEEYEVLSDYTGAHTKIKMRHLLCGAIYEVTPTSFIQGCRCPYCNHSHKRTTEEFVSLLSASAYGEEYAVLGEYVNCKTRVLVRHLPCGHEFDAVPNTLLRGHPCPYCNGHMKGTTDIFRQKISELCGDDYLVFGNYVDNDTKIELQHAACGHIYSVSPHEFLSGSRCPRCFGPTMYRTTESFREEVALAYDGKEYLVEDDYVDTKTKLTMLHLTCGRRFKCAPHAFLSGIRCPYCNKKSHGEQWIMSMLSDLGVDFVHECYVKWVLPSSSTTNHGHRFDFYLPSLPIYIEFDGEQHFNPKTQFCLTNEAAQENFGKNRTYDLEADRFIKENDLVCVRIRYLAMKYLDTLVGMILDRDLDALREDANVLIVNSNMTDEEEDRYFNGVSF